MIHNEMSFLFGQLPTPGITPPNITPMVNNMNGVTGVNNSGSIFGTFDPDNYYRIYKGIIPK